MKKLLYKIIPTEVILFYHKVHAYSAAAWYGFPSRNMKIIGITGTKGKTTTANFIWTVLQHGGKKTGLIGTANIRVGDNERMNEYHMTMPSPWIIQKLLKEMKDSSCEYVVMEVTSEGIKQSRHIGINFYIGVFTNLSPEHLPSHKNSYDVYAQTKKIFFENLSDASGYMVTNTDDPKSEYMSFGISVPIINYGIESGTWQATHILESAEGIRFQVNNEKIVSPILGKFNVYNILPAIIIGLKEGLDMTSIKQGILSLSIIPGRMERISVGQPFTVIVDYAHEKKSMSALLDAGQALKGVNSQSKLIVIYGAEGGGRDKRKRGEMSEVASKKADIAIVTTVDPYDDNPIDINNDIGSYLETYGMKKDETYYIIHDRKEAIKKALGGTGGHFWPLIAGAEQSMILPTGAVSWDDREITKLCLLELGYGK